METGEDSLVKLSGHLSGKDKYRLGMRVQQQTATVQNIYSSAV